MSDEELMTAFGRAMLDGEDTPPSDMDEIADAIERLVSAGGGRAEVPLESDGAVVCWFVAVEQPDGNRLLGLRFPGAKS